VTTPEAVSASPRAAAYAVRDLTADDVGAYRALRDHSFGFPDNAETDAAFRERMASTIGAFDGAGRLVSSAAGHRFETFVAGLPRRLLGIGAVQTEPSARRRGVARRLLVRLLERARDEGTGWSMLYPFDPRFYERLGWQALPTGVRLRLPIAAFGPPSTTDAVALEGPLGAALAPLYRRCAALWNFTNARTTGPWDCWDDLRPAAGERGAAFDLGDAYAVLQLRSEGADSTTLVVHDALWCSAAGYAALLRLLCAYNGQAEHVVVDVPRDSDLAWSWSDGHAVPAHGTRMVRVVDVAAALRGLPFPDAAGPVTLRVVDGLAPWNDGTWHVAADGEGCTVTPASGSADVHADVRALPLLVGGGATPGALRHAGLVAGDDAALGALRALGGERSPFHALSDRF